jgi:hypothetical protein
MNLHDAPVIEEPPEREPYTCPNCGAFRWYRTESGNYVEDHVIRFPGGAEDWNNQETDMTDAGPWKCWSCDTEADDDTSDWISENY